MNQIKQEAADRKQILFAAANSGKGFVSFYEEILNRKELRKRYIIKGGPGTGKSSFMKNVAADAEQKGMSVEYYRCSSDPDSLDGIVLDGRIALLDGTAPHSVEPTLPGVRDEIVNLGEFWDGVRLAERYNDIVAFGALKAQAYRKAYRFLSAAAEVEHINRELVAPSVFIEKMQKAVARSCRSLPDEREFRLLPGLNDSFGMKGSVRLDTYEVQAKQLFVIDDWYQTGSLYLSFLLEQAKKKGCSVRVSYSPLSPDFPNAVLFEKSGVCYVLGEHGEKIPDGRIHMRRFLNAELLKSVKQEFRYYHRLCTALTDSALEALGEAGRYHRDLETIYGSCMDFEAEQRFCRSFCQKIQ